MPLRLLLLSLVGCGFTHRGLKFVAPEQMVIAAATHAELLHAEVESKKGRSLAVPEEMVTEGRSMSRPVVLTQRDTLVLESTEKDVRLEIYTRGNGLFARHHFRRLYTLTGSLPLRYPNEVLLLPEDLDEPVRLSMRDLNNPFANSRVKHDDMILVRAKKGGRSTQQLFKRRSSGAYLNTFAGLLASVPVSAEKFTVAPLLAAGPTLGWRTRKASGPLTILDRVEVVASIGFGSTDAATIEGDVGDSISGYFNAALAGGGVRLFRVVSVQAYLNASKVFRNTPEASWTLAIGVDAGNLANATRSIFERLFFEHPIRERNKRRPKNQE